MNDELILALDVANFADAKKIVENLGDEVGFYKIGLEMMASGEYFKMIEFLKSKNKKVFADLKLYDIPQTVENAVRNLSAFEIDLLTIHATNFETMSRAAQNKGSMRIVAVTILTSFAKNDLEEIGFDVAISLDDLVLKKAGLALKAGLDGVVSSAMEAKNLRRKLGDDFLIITPGIRLEKSNDDQKRTASVADALSFGASHIVVGRPILKSENILEAAKKFNEEIKKFKS